jgi:hypothetical protein
MRKCLPERYLSDTYKLIFTLVSLHKSSNKSVTHNALLARRDYLKLFVINYLKHFVIKTYFSKFRVLGITFIRYDQVRSKSKDWKVKYNVI